MNITEKKVPENQINDESLSVERYKELFEYEMTEVKLLLAGRFKKVSDEDMNHAGKNLDIKTVELQGLRASINVEADDLTSKRPDVSTYKMDAAIPEITIDSSTAAIQPQNVKINVDKRDIRVHTTPIEVTSKPVPVKDIDKDSVQVNTTPITVTSKSIPVMGISKDSIQVHTTPIEVISKPVSVEICKNSVSIVPPFALKKSDKLPSIENKINFDEMNERVCPPKIDSKQIKFIPTKCSPDLPQITPKDLAKLNYLKPDIPDVEVSKVVPPDRSSSDSDFKFDLKLNVLVESPKVETNKVNCLIPNINAEISEEQKNKIVAPQKISVNQTNTDIDVTVKNSTEVTIKDFGNINIARLNVKSKTERMVPDIEKKYEYNIAVFNNDYIKAERKEITSYSVDPGQIVSDFVAKTDVVPNIQTVCSLPQIPKYEIDTSPFMAIPKEPAYEDIISQINNMATSVKLPKGLAYDQLCERCVVPVRTFDFAGAISGIMDSIQEEYNIDN